MKNFHSRANWGARPRKYINRGNLGDPSTGHWNGPKVIIRGSVTWDHRYCASLVRGVQNFHMDSRGWSDIAYNFIVCPHGHVYEGRGLNVWNGANGTNSGNRSSHAVMWLVGEGNPFPEVEKKAFADCVFFIATQTEAPNRAIGHRDHKATECPGDERYGWIHSGMPVAGLPVFPEEEDELMLAEMIKTLYNLARGSRKKPYQVEESDPNGYFAWLIATYHAKDPIHTINSLSDALERETGRKLPHG